MMTFADRHEAGKLLAASLTEYATNTIVFALPRGGVAIGGPVAQELNAPLGLVVARKIGHPSDPEYAVGAVTEIAPAVWNEHERANLDDTWATQAEAAGRAEVKRRQKIYLAGHRPVSAGGKTAIIVDDGIATGLTMQAAIHEVRQQKPARIVVAAPVASEEAVDILLEEADKVIILDKPQNFLGAVGSHYEEFPQLTDDDVIDILDRFEA
ncbi:MAG TPA: phosphoribosyltransferase family protein [Candidatus Saccharimonadales bacterium]|nr:phosphoribosyltransferase family protein [Candidatus Saccharimonadales bacterium]